MSELVPLNRILKDGGYTSDQRKLKSQTSFARVYYWHYLQQNFGAPTGLRGGVLSPTFIDVYNNSNLTNKNFIERDIVSLKVSKSVDASSATFDIILLPSVNWKQFIFPGDWLAIYLFDSFEEASQDPPSKNLVLVGNVDRVARTISKDEETDKTQLHYVINGRNFGKVFEETDLWFDPYANDAEVLNLTIQQEGLELTGSPDAQCSEILNIFLGPGDMDGKIKPLGQWQIPFQLSSFLYKQSPTTKSPIIPGSLFFYDILNIDITSNLPGFRNRNMITPDGNGNIYEWLKRSSNDLVNEIVIEEKRYTIGTFPTFQLSPRPFNTPFFDDNFGTQGDETITGADARTILKNQIVTLQQLAKTDFIQIAATEVVYEDLGKDDHSRMNSFMLRSGQELDFTLAEEANLNNPNTSISNPMPIRESIKRHGLKRFDHDLEYVFSDVSTTVQDNELFQAFMMQLYDQNFVNHLYENGTIECNGILEAELGKALVLLPADAPDNISNGNYPEGTKIFYIEGYEHSWEFPNHWKTIFTVSKGQFYRTDKNIFIDAELFDFGSPDKDIELVVAQTDFIKDSGPSQDLANSGNIGNVTGGNVA